MVRKLAAVGLLLVLSLGSVAQCPSGADLCKAVEDSRKESSASSDSVLKRLLKLERLAVRCNLSLDSGVVSLHQRLAALYFNSDNYAEAAKYIDQSLAEYNRAPGKQSLTFKARILFTQGMIYKSLPDLERAVRALDSAIYFFNRYPVVGQQLVFAYKNLANVHFQLGDYARALLLSDQSIIEAKAASDSVLESLARIEKAMALEALGNYEDALHEIKKADSLSMVNDYSPVEKGNLYSVRASIERKLHHFSDALAWYDKCATMYRKGESKEGRLLATNNIGDIYLNDLHNAKQALTYFLRSLPLASSTYDSLRIYTNIGDVYQALNDYTIALEFYQRGLQCIFPMLSHSPTINPPANEFATIPNLEYVFTLITNKSICWSKMSSTNKAATNAALEGYRLADKIVDALSWENFMSASRIYWRSKTHELYERAISACYITHDMASAFYFFEKSRAVILNERTHETRLLTGGNRNLLNEIAMLRKSINNYKDRSIASNVSTKSSDDRQFLKSQERYEYLMATIRKTHPYLFSTFLDTAHSSLSDRQIVLRTNGQELIETFVGDSNIFVFHLSSKNIALDRIDATGYQSLLSKFLLYCRNQEKLNSDYGGFCSISSQLFQMLFGKLRLSGKRLVISPDGMFFPFEALKRSGDVAKNDFLLNDYAISYAYAARSVVPDNDESPNNAGFLGIAPVQFNASFRLPELVGSDESLVSISNSMGSKKMLLDKDASKENFLHSFYRYQCIQLYTHAADSSARNEPVIYLSDSLLYLSDLIPESDVQTRLVVLSACETGVGKWSKGEGVFSFNRGFAELGIPSTVSTLWPIDNQSMYQLTELFYKFLSEGLKKDEALQRAKLAFIAKSDGVRKLPFNWAAAVLIGDTSPLTFKNDHKKTIIAMLAMIVLLGALILFFLQRRKFSSLRLSDYYPSSGYNGNDNM